MRIKDYFLNERPVLAIDKMFEMCLPGVVVVNELRRKYFHERGLVKIGHIQEYGDLEYSMFDECEKSFLVDGGKVYIKRNRYGRFLVSDDVKVSKEVRPRTKPSEIKQYCVGELNEFKMKHPEHADNVDNMIVKYDINKEPFDV